jgi:hypothetical protein
MRVNDMTPPRIATVGAGTDCEGVTAYSAQKYVSGAFVSKNGSVFAPSHELHWEGFP